MEAKKKIPEIRISISHRTCRGEVGELYCKCIAEVIENYEKKYLKQAEIKYLDFEFHPLIDQPCEQKHNTNFFKSSDIVIFLINPYKGLGKYQEAEYKELKSIQKNNVPQLYFYGIRKRNKKDYESKMSPIYKIITDKIEEVLKPDELKGRLDREFDPWMKSIIDSQTGGDNSGKKGVPMWLKLILRALILAIIGELLMHFGDRKTDSIVPVNENAIAETVVKDSVKNDNSTGNHSQPDNPSDNAPGNKVEKSKTIHSQGITGNKGQDGQGKDGSGKKEPPAEKGQAAAAADRNAVADRKVVYEESQRLRKENRLIYVSSNAKNLSGEEVDFETAVRKSLTSAKYKCTTNPELALWSVNVMANAREEGYIQEEGRYCSYVDVVIKLQNEMTGEIIFENELHQQGGSDSSFAVATKDAFRVAKKKIGTVLVNALNDINQ